MVDFGCGTVEHAFWAKHVTAIDHRESALARAAERAGNEQDGWGEVATTFTWKSEALGPREMNSARRITVSKRHPSNAALTIVDVRVLDGVFESPRAAYAHEYGERDRALPTVAHDPRPVFEDVDSFGVPGLRVKMSRLVHAS